MQEFKLMFILFLTKFVSAVSSCAGYCDGLSECYYQSDVCDGIRDCLDGSDEADCCEPGEYSCDDGLLCYPEWFKCDGTRFCADGSDEKDCPSGCVAYYDLNCDGGKKCFSSYAVCDGVRYCDDGSDEANCEDKQEETDQSGSLDFETFGKIMGAIFIVMVALLFFCRMCCKKNEDDILTTADVDRPLTANIPSSNTNTNDNNYSAPDRTYTTFPCAGAGQPPQSHQTGDTSRLHVTLPPMPVPPATSGQSLVNPPPHEALTPESTAPPPSYESLFPEAKRIANNP